MDDRDPPVVAPDLQARIDEARRKAAGPAPKPPSAKAAGMRVAAELLAGVVFGIIAGIALDRWLGTAPWLMVTMILLGMTAGIRNVIRAGNVENRKAREEDSNTGP